MATTIVEGICQAFSVVAASIARDRLGPLGIVLGLLIGVGCRWFGIPLPGPPAIFGAVLAVAMATGYTTTDRLLPSRQGNVPTHAEATATHDGALAEPRSADR